MQRLYFKVGLSKRKIAKQLGVSRNFVLKWTKEPMMLATTDHRGWIKGKRRKWDAKTEKRITHLHAYLLQSPAEFYTGATAILQQWRDQYPDDVPPPLRTIGQILKELDLSDTRPGRKGKGAAKYLCYPEYAIHHVMGTRVLEIDFIGKKFIQGRTAPLNFLGFSFKYAPKLRYYVRITAESGTELIDHTDNFFHTFEKPDALKMDNGFAMTGGAPQPRVLNKVPIWLLAQQVMPIYAVPRKPFSQASIEGNNSVFARKFWNTFHYESVEQVDSRLPLFNQASLRYCQYERPEISSQCNIQPFHPNVYFLRQVREIQDQPCIELVHDTVRLPRDYINYFVFAQWDLIAETLHIYIEQDKVPILIDTVDFKLNPKSKDKLKQAHIL